jgi:phosphatidate cytidylyltransferase
MNDTANSGVEKKTSDLKTRLISAAVMALIAGFALWVGSWLFTLFVILIALALMFEWYGLVENFSYSKNITYAWIAVGVLYIGFASFTLIYFRLKDASFIPTLMLLLVVIATDAGAYFAGRKFGGKKLAPSISPGKTWAGLLGGMIAAGLLWSIYSELNNSAIWYAALGSGMAMAILAQMGDLFESWMKRKAGKKDSSTIIPGHGGLFDRADGILAVFFVLGIFHIPLYLANF